MAKQMTMATGRQKEERIESAMTVNFSGITNAHQKIDIKSKEEVSAE